MELNNLTIYWFIRWNAANSNIMQKKNNNEKSKINTHWIKHCTFVLFIRALYIYLNISSFKPILIDFADDECVHSAIFTFKLNMSKKFWLFIDICMLRSILFWKLFIFRYRKCTRRTLWSCNVCNENHRIRSRHALKH